MVALGCLPSVYSLGQGHDDPLRALSEQAYSYSVGPEREQLQRPRLAGMDWVYGDGGAGEGLSLPPLSNVET